MKLLGWMKPFINQRFISELIIEDTDQMMVKIRKIKQEQLFTEPKVCEKLVGSKISYTYRKQQAN